MLCKWGIYGLATSLTVPKDLYEQLEIAFQHPSTTIDTIVVNDTLGIPIADVGINAELIYNYEKSKSSGMLGYANKPFLLCVNLKGHTSSKLR